MKSNHEDHKEPNGKIWMNGAMDFRDLRALHGEINFSYKKKISELKNKPILKNRNLAFEKAFYEI